MIDWWLELVSHYFEIVFSWLSIIRRPGRVRYLLCIFMLRHFTGLSQCVGHNVVMVRCLGCTYSILFTQPPPGRRCKELPNTVANSSRLENTSILIDLFETFSKDIWTWYVRRIQVQKYLQHTKCWYCNTIDIVYYPSIWIYYISWDKWKIGEWCGCEWMQIPYRYITWCWRCWNVCSWLVIKKHVDWAW